ncbi:rod shape-determining protein RodA [Candidatus Oleimmundimicrobium sp.]|uniref:rod shape-determining protein RodA n=1 Tax=Candidatus Oleimmundimicrobium sp. TaxID=3060597 RepID=UPI0027270A51|nr:rod shape-determining protein RodA [Candidatus Oleimmundimicrobium sp.]MDO8886142.1 rod shape-determining protein RodA [Candidatus Oleimmundimicrobium sp.]
MKKHGVFEWFRFIDFSLIAITTLLVVYGNLMVYSATRSSQGDPFFYLKKQIIFTLLGILVAVGIALLNYNWFRHYMVPLYIGNIALLLLVLLIGLTTYGATRWISIGFFNLQPSELAKIILILTLSAVLADKKGNIGKISELFTVFAYVGLPLLLIVVQPDLGTGLVLVAITLGLLFISGLKWQHALLIFGIVVLVIFLIFQFNLLKEYQMSRLMVFFNSSADPLGAGYNLLQSKVAIGSGGFLGTGLFSGTQTGLKFLPVRHADFIFSVVGEELGFLGSSFLLGLYFILITRGLAIGASAGNLYGTLVAVGISSMWLFQVLVNVGMTMGIMPITGIPLPFFSYGGSSMLINFAGVGLLLNIYARRFK